MEINESSKEASSPLIITNTTTSNVPSLQDSNIQFIIDLLTPVQRPIKSDPLSVGDSRLGSDSQSEATLIDTSNLSPNGARENENTTASKSSLRKVLGQVLSRSSSSLSLHSENDNLTLGKQLINKVSGYLSPFQSRNSSSVSLSTPAEVPSELDKESELLDLSTARRHTTVVPSINSKLSIPVDEKGTLRSYTPERVKETRHVYVEYDPVTKRKVLNTYEILRSLGKGQHGKVKLARDMLSHRLVAIKILDRRSKPKLGKLTKPGSSQEDKIRREIAIMKKCDHPHVVKLIEVLDDLTSRKIYMVLEYLEKGEIKWQTVNETTHETHPVLTFKKAQKVFRDVILGLEYLHYQGIIHRDIKPANLLVSADNVVKISDFGVSFASSLDYADNELELCKTAGTPAFLAPELCETDVLSQDKEMKVDHKIDIWALGVTLFCLLFGRLPFNSDSEFKLFEVINNEELQIPDKSTLVNPEEVNDFEWDIMVDILQQLLKKNPAERIDIPEIKHHDFFLHGLTKLESQKYLTANDSVKLHVSNEEVDYAVVGIGSKIKKTLVKALKRGFSTPDEYPSSKNTSQSPDYLDSMVNSTSSSTKHSTLKLNESVNRSLILSELLSPDLSSTSVGNGAHTPIPKSLASIKSSLGERRGSADMIETRDILQGTFKKSSNAALDEIMKLNQDEPRSPVGVNTYLQEETKSRQGSVDLSMIPPVVGRSRGRLLSNASLASLDSYHEESNVIDFSGFVPVRYPGTEANQSDKSGIKFGDVNYHGGHDDYADEPQLYEPTASTSTKSGSRRGSTCSSSSVSEDVSGVSTSSDSETGKSDIVTALNTQLNANRSPFHKNRFFSLHDSGDDSEKEGSTTDDDDDGKELMFAFGPPRDDPPYLKSRVMSYESNIPSMMRPASTNSMSMDTEYVIPLSSSTVDLPEEFLTFIPEFKSPSPSVMPTGVTSNYVSSPLKPKLDVASSRNSLKSHSNDNASITASVATSPKSRLTSTLLTGEPPRDSYQYKNHYAKANNIIPFEKAHHLGHHKAIGEATAEKRFRNNSITIGLLQSGHESEKETTNY